MKELGTFLDGIKAYFFKMSHSVVQAGLELTVDYPASASKALEL